MNIKIAYLTTLIFIFSCTRSTTYINREDDKKAAIEVTDNFFTAVKNKNYNNIYVLFSKGNQALTVEQRKLGIQEQMEKIERNLGIVTSFSLISCETKRIEGNKPFGEYRLTFKVVRSSRNFKDSFRLLLEDSQIHIADYDVNPI